MFNDYDYDRGGGSDDSEDNDDRIRINLVGICQNFENTDYC